MKNNPRLKNQLKSIHLRLSSNTPSVMQVISVRSTWISDGGILLKLMIFLHKKVIDSVFDSVFLMRLLFSYGVFDSVL